MPEGLEATAQAFNGLMTSMADKLPSTPVGITTRDEQVNPSVKVRIYHPRQQHEAPLPLIVFCHGGGWIAGNLDTEDHTCRTICGEVKCIVVSVEYRLATHKFPLPIDDCFAGYQWVRNGRKHTAETTLTSQAYESASELGADQSRFLVCGGSAGGALALAVAYRLTSQRQKDRIQGLILMAPMCLHPDAVPPKYSNLHRSMVELSGDIPFVTTDMVLSSYELLGAKPPYTDETKEWFPAMLGSDALQDMPKTYIVNCEIECMRDDGAVLEAELSDAGVDVKRDVMLGLPHYSWSFPLEKVGQRFRRNLVEGIKWVLK
ncbi:hypothetical protein LTR15_000019 [Elasticomyces elasticus]|nr:hypothetical protein LTR15_000019 [Elasticomyces elasticus]